VPLPPMIVRRLVLAPLALLLSLLLLILFPVFILIAFVVDLSVSRGRWQTTRLTAFCIADLAYEVLGFFALFGLWVASGFGLRIRSERMREVHYRFLRWWLRGLNGAARKLFRLKIWIEDRPEPRPGSILVFSRHAGPGNSLMLIGTLMIGYRRNPRIVMLAKLQWEPLFDVMLNRLPNRFIQHDPNTRRRYLDAITDLAAGLGDRDAFVLFPEGHDFTPRLRLRAIDHLKRKGFHRHAERAEGMSKVLPPKHGGVMAAIAGAPDADIVFVAHTVLEDVGSFKDLWRRIPLDRPILSRYWRIDHAEVPDDRDQLIDWLYDWWARIDRWIEERRSLPAEAVPAHAVEG